MKTWKIKSTSDPSKNYQVTMVTEWDWQCSCPDFVLRHHECKHIKGVQKAYDKRNKQNTQSEPTPDGSQATEVPSDDRGHGQERDSVQSGELRRSDSVDGNPAGIHPGTEQTGSGGHSSSSENAETSVGTPNVEPDVPGSAQGSDQTSPWSDQGLRDASEKRERLEREKADQQAKYDKWQLRETHFSKDLHTKLQQLRVRWTNEIQNRKTIEMMIMPIHTAIRLSNKKDWKAKPDFDTSLINVDLSEMEPETTDQLEVVKTALF